MPPRPLSLRALNRATLARQMLLARENASPVEAIERLAGMQAQLARPPYIGLWSRIEGFQRDSLTAAVLGREAVRATMMRGTIHLVSRKDYLAFRPALQPMLTRGANAVLRGRQDAIDKSVMARARRFFEQKPRTFDELRKYLLSIDPDVDERAVAYVMRMNVPLVQVPVDGAAWGYPGSAAFALAESWLGVPLPGEGGTDALVLRYLAAFGPATAADLQTWSGLQGGREIVDKVRKKLEVLIDDRGRELVDLPDAPRPGEDVPAPVRFLPDYDNLLLSHADRRRIIADDHRPRVSTANLGLLATFLVDGFVAGTWRVTRKKGEAALAIEPFGKLSKSVRAEVIEEAERLVRFVEPEAKTFRVEFAAKKSS